MIFERFNLVITRSNFIFRDFLTSYSVSRIFPRFVNYLFDSAMRPLFGELLHGRIIFFLVMEI